MIGDLINQKHHLYEVLTACRFYVALHLDGSRDDVDGYFMECRGFKYSQTVITHNEVFPKRWGKATRGQVICTKLPGNNNVDNFSLRRGLTASTTLWDWIATVHDGGWVSKFKNGFLTIYRQDSSEGARFAFSGGWPVSYSITDNMASGSDLAVEELEIACEGFERIL
ncbi:MAG: phage tail protein [Arthrospira sp. SH-MAG29]|nr:phage tail protein [Arthrospira sp. SH-MAG29]MBS0015263.1 phage tail protein [Arthrospira sp. SH-MAG29]